VAIIIDIFSNHTKVILAAAIPQIDLYISLVGALGGSALVNNFSHYLTGKKNINGLNNRL
jgi:hypothetical protein